ncbi:MAG: trypsin-like serine protease [Deltaproteobacteria bacterium]|jgi:trypsin
MKHKRLAVVLVSSIAACVPTPPEAPQESPVEEGVGKSAIVGGQSTSISQHPWQVSVGSTNFGWFCGGSIIAPDWVLTAQHCIEGTSVSTLRIAAGVTRRSSINGSAQVRSVDQLLPFPGYIEPERGRDVALLHLSQPLSFNGNVQAIPIATAGDAMNGLTDPGVNAIVSGWGTLRSGGSSPDTLQEVTVPIVSQDQANQAYGGGITSDQIGAGLLGVGGRDSCQGDSGGPLTVPDGNGGRLLAGVVSWGFGCADARFPGMYARVSSFSAWIQSNVSPNVPPTVSIVSPSNGATLSGNVTVRANASDADGTVTRVAFLFPDGTRLDDTSAPFEVTWNSASSGDGPGTISAQAQDDAGAVSNVASISVITNNGNSNCASGTRTSIDTPVGIPDNNAGGVVSTINVNGVGTITDFTVSLAITHTWRGDLTVQLTSPAGTTVTLHNREGRSADDVVINDLDLAAFDGESASGAWRLSVRDLAGQDVGTLDTWSFSLSASCNGGGGNTGWSGSSSPNLATQDNGVVCDTINVSASGDASDLRMDLDGVHDWRSILRGTLEHNGTTVEVFGTGTFPRQGGSFGFTDEAVGGFSGSASGAWTFCLFDTDAFGDSGTLRAWSVHD